MEKINFRSVRSLICLFFAAAILVGCFGYAFAAPLPYVDRPKVREFVAPGEQVYGVIIMENPTPDARTMRLYIEDWYYVPGGDGSKEFVPSGSLVRSCAPWVTFSPAQFTIPAFGQQRINYSIKVPENAKGGYYASLFFETIIGKAQEGEKDVQMAGINLAVRIATLFYVEAKDTVQRKADIKNLTVKKDDPKGLKIELDMENTGNVDITCGGTFHIIDKSGMILARGTINKVYTFPSDKVKVVAAWAEDLPKGVYDLVLTLDLGKALEETGSGRGPVVTMEAEIEIGPGGSVVRATESDKKSQ